MTTGLVVALFLVLAKFNVLKGIMFVFVPVIFFVMFFYMIRLPDLKISRKEKDISKEITDKIDLGTSMEDALNEAVEFIPSNDFRKILWQIINSIRTGSNVAKSLYSVMEQITKDQITEVNKYGKKLNPLAMFYMIVAVILPSLGMTILIILSSFIKFELSLTILLSLAGFLGFVQFMFIAMIKFSRPAIEF